RAPRVPPSGLVRHLAVLRAGDTAGHRYGAAGAIGRRESPRARPHAGRCSQSTRPYRHEPRLGSTGSGGGAHPGPPARSRSAAGHLWNAWRLALLERRHDEALTELEEAERLDPLDLQVKTQIGYVHHFHHDVDRAIEQFEKVLTLEPSFAFAHYALGDACTEKGQFDRAFAEFNRAIELGGRSVNHIGVLGYAYGRSGNLHRAKEHLQELTVRAAHDYVSAMWLALVHLGLS